MTTGEERKNRGKPRWTISPTNYDRITNYCLAEKIDNGLEERCSEQMWISDQHIPVFIKSAPLPNVSGRNPYWFDGFSAHVFPKQLNMYVICPCGISTPRWLCESPQGVLQPSFNCKKNLQVRRRLTSRHARRNWGVSKRDRRTKK